MLGINGIKMRREVYSLLLAANMFKIVLVAALAGLTVDARFLSQAPQVNGRIVGGVDANIEDYPYHVSLQRFGHHGCGGSIITVSNIILTAAHCTFSISASRLSVRYGTSLKDQGGSVLNVSEVFPDSRHDPFTQDYDVALLKLDGYVLFSSQVRPIFLASSDVQEGGRSAKVTGWGRIYSGGPLSEQLQVVEVQEVDRDECLELYGADFTERMICFVGDGKDACQYDSGGPLVYRNGHAVNQIGVVSWGYGCANASYPGVYSNLHNVDIVDHIVAIITEHGLD